MDSALVLAISVLVAATATPLVIRIARRLDIVDKPGLLKTHDTPIAYLGGVAVFCGLIVGPLVAGRPLVLMPMVLALALGIWDDRRPIEPRLRLLIELAIGAVAFACAPGAALVRIATAVLVVVLLNAVNLLDGQDGLASGFGIVAAVGFATLGGDATPIGLAIAGALGGFLIYNRFPARIYLGDGGAYLLGASLAMLPVLTHPEANAVSLWIAVPLLVALPLADTAIAILRRLRLHERLFIGDRSHIYDQLIDQGHTVPISTLLCVAAQVPLSAAGVFGAQLSPLSALAVTVVGVGSVFTAALLCGFLSTKGTS
ncbi:MAG: undecaprenyl/decaprenyl-phosphate alpha-N-acetylglucosaminyl 1-phosphate transferase [Acidimicrobiia bacterium]|nr:undecaprenyl/decaprenyl-phosphate alpha-N-acetylglucosaminyl 1-phosphate transferase [Acidimicrobiia bacterium]